MGDCGGGGAAAAELPATTECCGFSLQNRMDSLSIGWIILEINLTP